MERYGPEDRSSTRRPQTPHDFSLLKTLRLQEDAISAPTLASAYEQPHPSHSAQHSSSRPATPPNQQNQPSILQPLNNTKHDSALASSDSPAGRDSLNAASEPGSFPYQPSLPAIVVQDESVQESPRNKLPFMRRRKKNSAGEKELRTGGHMRIQSFHGISMDIPTGDLGELHDPENLHFSTRGSMLLGTEKADALIGTVMNESGKVASTEKPRQGLKSGRRKPSVHMLQAAINGGRVLSAEEITFSMRVRSMYDRGEEDSREWTVPPGGASLREPTPEPEVTAEQPVTRPPTADSTALKVSKTRKSNLEDRPRTATSPRLESSLASREVAGGMEDWEDVEVRDVDRYGFINPDRTESRTSSRESRKPPIRPRIQRVSTSLQLIADSPRRKRSMRRGASNATARSARLTPPGRTNDTRSIRKQPSLYSSRSTSSSLFETRPFRSRKQRLMDEASDMLTLPPGLESIAEQEDGGRTANILKRREWAREEKWRSMAKVAGRNRGEGMSFEFDTRDPKLINRTWKGIPDRWRATAWHSFLTASAKRRGQYVPDKELIARFHELQEENSADDVQIDVDVPRTISMHIMFRRRYRGGQRLLFRVLHAISIHFPDVGYVQGMASLAATLLCYYDEERAFVMLVRLWQLRGLEVLYRPGFDGLMAALSEFEKDWLGDGGIARKLQELGITSTAYGTRWYLTLFNMSIPFPAQLRVWDVFMLLGDEVRPVGGTTFGGTDLDVLHATSAALLDATRDIVLDSDFENAMKVLTSWVPVKDEDLFMRVARAEYRARKKRAKD